MLITLVPMAKSVSAATTYTADKVLYVSAGSVVGDGNFQINKIVIKSSTVDAVYTGDEVILQLPANFKMTGMVIVPQIIEGKMNDIRSISVDDSTPGTGIPFTEKNRIKIKIADVFDWNEIPYINVSITKLSVPSSASGDGKISAEARSGSGFSDGEAVIACVKTGQVAISIDDVVSITSSGKKIEELKIKETLGNSLKPGNGSLEFKLPDGFKWDCAGHSLNLIWGDFHFMKDLSVSTGDSGRTLLLNVNDALSVGSSQATYFSISGLRIDVDESVAKHGKVEAAISGRGSVTPNSITVASYGGYKVNISSVETKKVCPGMRKEEIGKFAIEEEVPGTITNDRNITLTLPDKVKWDDEYPSISAADSKLLGFGIGPFVAVDADKRKIKAKVMNASNGDKSTKIVFKGGRVTVAADYKGNIDLKVEISGLGNISNSVTVADVKAPIKVAASGKPEVKIGVPDQKVADIVITETNKEALERDKSLTLKTPYGIRFSSIPKFEVTEGDISLKTAIKTGDDRIIEVKIKTVSSKASTIKISDVKLTIDRTVPEGNVNLKIGGSSLIENESLFPPTVL